MKVKPWKENETNSEKEKGFLPPIVASETILST